MNDWYWKIKYQEWLLRKELEATKNSTIKAVRWDEVYGEPR